MEEEAAKAFDAGDFDKALELYERLAALHYPDAYFSCGLIYEHGSSSRGQDFQIAYSYFDRLRIEWAQSEGYVGCARIILSSREIDKTGLAKRYCDEAIELDGNPFAYLVLGQIQEEFLGNHAEARKNYVRAARRGAAWGMRLYARSHFDHGNKFVGVVAHVLVTIVHPFFLMFRGLSATRTG